ncbi:Protease HtpX [Tepidimonas sediminis]|uniref:Protease HtpX n=1 Tax=Tepidimonas sediminis TaxID=2588941 RepID=A0A554WLK9_9BURK|nr:M48 family metalloprotease [Tepidimonas sediminis]TSE24449.1 Protease HtpX [Tepidimonas sediminis]
MRAFFDRQAEARRQTRRLLVLFGLMVAAVVAAVNGALALAWRLMAGGGWLGYPRFFFEVNTGVTLLFVLGGWWLESNTLRHEGGAALARRLGARPAREADFDERRLVHVVREMALAAGMTPPAVMVIERDAAINAFATGWDERDAVVALTEGALRHLTRAELQGVVAHELSHIREGDTRLNMRLVGMVYGLEMLYRLGEQLMEPDARGRRHAGALIGLALRVAGWLGWVAGHALQAAVARQREFLADARAVQWTRQRDGLGRALRKVLGQRRGEGDAGDGPLPLPQARHLWLVSVPRDAWLPWFDPHPPLAQRIARLYGGTMPPLPPHDGLDAADEPVVPARPTPV